jgi:hypothetical protein
MLTVTHRANPAHRPDRVTQKHDFRSAPAKSSERMTTFGLPRCIVTPSSLPPRSLT